MKGRVMYVSTGMAIYKNGDCIYLEALPDVDWEHVYKTLKRLGFETIGEPRLENGMHQQDLKEVAG